MSRAVPIHSGFMTDGVVRVFLLDDHEVVRRGLRDLLEALSLIHI